MKKKIGILLSVLSMLAIFSIPAMAAETNTAGGFFDIGTKENVVIKPFVNNTEATVTERNVDSEEAADQWYKDSNRLEVSYNAASSGGYYGVVLVEGSELPTKDTEIYFIDQLTAGSATIDFNVYPILPEETTDMTLYISSNVEGFDLVNIPLNYAANVLMYTLGKVNGDARIDSLDALEVLKFVAELREFTETERAAADVNGDGKIDSLDALDILKYVAELIDSFKGSK